MATVGQQNNNPLNLKIISNDPAKDWEGRVGVDGQGHVIFENSAVGRTLAVRANVMNIWAKFKQGSDTPDGLVSQWTATAGDRSSYADRVMKAAGLPSTSSKLNFEDVGMMVRVFRAMEMQENANQLVVSDAELKAGFIEGYKARGYTITPEQVDQAIQSVKDNKITGIAAVRSAPTAADSAEKLYSFISQLPDVARALTPTVVNGVNPARQEVDNVLYEPIGVAANGKEYFKGVGFIDPSKANGAPDPTDQIFERTEKGFRRVLQDVPGGAALFKQATQIREAVKGVKFEGEAAADYSKLALAITAAELQDTGGSSAGAIARKPDEVAAEFAKTAAKIKEIETGLGRKLSAQEFYLAHHLSRKNIEAGAITQAIKAINENPDASIKTALSAETLNAIGNIYVDSPNEGTKVASDDAFTMGDLAQWSSVKVQYVQAEESAMERRRTDVPTIKQNPLAESLANIQATIKQANAAAKAKGLPAPFETRQQIDAAILAELKRAPDPNAPAKGLNAYLAHEFMRYAQIQYKRTDLVAKGIDAAKYKAERGFISVDEAKALLPTGETDIEKLVASGRIKKQTEADGTVSYIDPEKAYFGEESQKVHQAVADGVKESGDDTREIEGVQVGGDRAKEYARERKSAEAESEARRQEARVRDQQIASGIGMELGDAMFMCLLFGLMTGRWDLAQQLFSVLTAGSRNGGGPTTSASDRNDYRKGDGPTQRYEKRRDVEEKPARAKPPFGSGYPTGFSDIVPETTHALPINKSGPLYQQFWIPSRASSVGDKKPADAGDGAPQESAKGVVVIVNRDTGKVLYAAEHPADIEGDLENGGRIVRWGTTSGADRDMKAYWDAYAYILGRDAPGITADSSVSDVVKAGQAKLDQIAKLNSDDPDYKAKLKAITGEAVLPEGMTTLSRDPARWKALIVKESQPINGRVDTNFTPLKGLPNSQYSVNFDSKAWGKWASYITDPKINGAIPIHILPVDAENMRITSHRGPRWGRNHDGVDIGNGSGKLHNMIAPADGIILAYQNNGNDNSSYLAIGHSDGSVTVLRHVRIADGVEVGKKVDQGQVIATMGTPNEIHVHYERWDRFGRHAPLTVAGIGDIGDSSKFPKADIAPGTPRFGIAQSREALAKINAEIAAKQREADAAAEAAKLKAAALAEAEAKAKAAADDLAAKQKIAADAAADVQAKEKAAATAADAAQAQLLLDQAKAAAAKATEDVKAADDLLTAKKSQVDAVRAAITAVPDVGATTTGLGPETGMASNLPNAAISYAQEIARFQAEYLLYMKEQAKNSPPAAGGKIPVPPPYPTKSIVNGFTLPAAAKAQANEAGWVFYAVAHSKKVNAKGEAIGWDGEVGFYNIKTNEHVWFPASGGGKGPETQYGGSTPGMIDLKFGNPGEGLNAIWPVNFEAGHRFDPQNGIIRLQDSADKSVAGRDGGWLVHTDFGSYRNSNGCPHVPAEMIPLLMDMFKRTGVSKLEMLNMPFVKQLLEEAEKIKYQRPAQPIAARTNGMTAETTLAKLNDGWVPYYYAIEHIKGGVTPELKGIKALTVVIDPDSAMYDGVLLREMSPQRKQEVIKELRDGGRTVIAYRSIGEAQNYQYSWYWNQQWDAKETRPKFLRNENPDWKGNFQVDFKSDATAPVVVNGKTEQWTWKQIVQEDIKRAIDMGFDSVYLDVVDVYAHVGRSAKDMVDFVNEVTKYARDKGRDIIIQNSLELIRDNPEIYQYINGVGVENTFTVTRGGTSVVPDWKNDNLKVIDAILSRKGRDGRDMYVLGIDYTLTPAGMQEFTKAAFERGMIPFNGDKDANLQGKSWDENRMAWARAVWSKLSDADKLKFATRITNVAPPAKVSIIDGYSPDVEGEVRVTKDPSKASHAVVVADPKDPTKFKLVRGNNPDSTDVRPASTMKMATLWYACKILKDKDPSGALLKKFLDSHDREIKVMMHWSSNEADYNAVATTVAVDAAVAAGIKGADSNPYKAFINGATEAVRGLLTNQAGIDDAFATRSFTMTGPGGSGLSTPRAMATIGFVAQRDFRDVLDRFSKAADNTFAKEIYAFNPALTHWGKPGKLDDNVNFAWVGAAPGIGYSVFANTADKLTKGIAAAETKRTVIPQRRVEPATDIPVTGVKKIKITMLDAGHGPVPDVGPEGDGHTHIGGKPSIINIGGGSIKGGLSEFQANLLQVYATGIEMKKAGEQPTYTHLTKEQNLALIKSGSALPPGITEDDIRQAQNNPAIMAKIEQTHRWYQAAISNPKEIGTRFDWRFQAAIDMRAAGYDVNYLSLHHDSNNDKTKRGFSAYAHPDAKQGSFLLANIIAEELVKQGEIISPQSYREGSVNELNNEGRVTDQIRGWMLGKISLNKTSVIQPTPYKAPDKPEWDVANGLGDIPASLIELRFATNPQDAALMMDPVARFASARRIAKAIIEQRRLNDLGITTVEDYQKYLKGILPGKPVQALPQPIATGVERTKVLTGKDLDDWKDYFTRRIFKSESADDKFHYDELGIPTSGAGLTPMSLIQAMAQFPKLFDDPKWQALKDSLAGKKGQPAYEFGKLLEGGQYDAVVAALKSSTRDDATQILFNKYLIASGVINIPVPENNRDKSITLRESVLDMAFNSSVEQAIICLRHTLNAKGFKVPDVVARGRLLTDEEKATYGRIDPQMQQQIEAWIKSYSHPNLAMNDYAKARIDAYEDMVRRDNEKFVRDDLEGYAGHVKNINGWRNRVSKYIVNAAGEAIGGSEFTPAKQRMIGWSPPTDLEGVDYGARDKSRFKRAPERHLRIIKPAEVFWQFMPRRGAALELPTEGMIGAVGDEVPLKAKLAVLPVSGTELPKLAGVLVSDTTNDPVLSSLVHNGPAFVNPQFAMLPTDMATLLPAGFKLSGVSTGDIPTGDLSLAALGMLTGLKKQVSAKVKTAAELLEEQRVLLAEQERIATLLLENAKRLEAAQLYAEAHKTSAEAFMVMASSMFETSSMKPVKAANDEAAEAERARIAAEQAAARAEAIRLAAIEAEKQRIAALEKAKGGQGGDDKKTTGQDVQHADVAVPNTPIEKGSSTKAIV